MRLGTAFEDVCRIFQKHDLAQSMLLDGKVGYRGEGWKSQVFLGIANAIENLEAPRLPPSGLLGVAEFGVARGTLRHPDKVTPYRKRQRAVAQLTSSVPRSPQVNKSRVEVNIERHLQIHDHLSQQRHTDIIRNASSSSGPARQ